MPKQLKVYGGFLIPNCSASTSRQAERAVVAAHSIKEVAELTGMSQYEIRGWWCETGNKEELALALNNPHTVIHTGKF